MNNKNKRIYLYLLILGISIGFAALTSQLLIIGNTLITKQTWDVHWENVRVATGSVSASEPVIDSDRTNVTFSVNLVKPGDYYEFTVDAKNDGTVDSMVSTVSNIITDESSNEIALPDYLEYTVGYSDNNVIRTNNLLEAGNKETYKVRVAYRSDRLADSNTTLTFSFNVNYVQANNDGYNEEDLDVKLQNPTIVANTVNADLPKVNLTGDKVSYDLVIDDTSDVYEYTIDAVNVGSMDAMITSMSTSPLTAEQSNLLDYEVTYAANGLEVEGNDLLAEGDSLTYDVKISVKDNVTISDPINVNTTLGIDYDKADENAVRKVVDPRECSDNLNISVGSDIVCKRAEMLHSELCEITSGGCYAAGYYANGSKETDTIIYGNCGTRRTLSVGDAFTCDVDSDGIFDEEKERFYYVSPEDANESSRNVTLIYYNNVSNGLPNSNAPIRYNTSSINYNGPTGLINDLPEYSSKWKNIHLSRNIKRQIINDKKGTTTGKGNNTLPVYVYSGRASRLLTVHEVAYGCNVSIVTASKIPEKCYFLVENTKFSTDTDKLSMIWLETPIYDYSSTVYSINTTPSLWPISVASYPKVGVRPAIVVNKDYIDY